MISHYDSYGFMHQVPRVRQFAEPDFMPWNNGWDPLIDYSVQLDPTFDWGYRPALEPYANQEIKDPKPASCMALCREAINQLQNDFDLDDVFFLVQESGYCKSVVHGATAQLIKKMGYSSLRRGRHNVTYYKSIDYQI